MKRMSSVSWTARASALALFGFSTLSLAEPTLRYNYDYVCDRGLRIVVGHCRHDSDMPGVAPTAPEDDYCQVYYPDRPKTGGIEAMETVLRSHLIESLQACGALGATTPGSNARQPPVTAAPSRPPAPPPAPAPAATAAPAGTRPATLSGQSFCDAIRHAGSLAGEGFRSVDLGPGVELSETINVHNTSLGLPGAGAERCGVTHESGKPNEYACDWPESDSAEQQILELAQTLKTCVGGQYEFHERKGDIDPYATARNAGVEYEAALIFNFVTDVDWVSLTIRPIKDAPAAAAASGAAPVAAPGIGKAHWRNLDFGDDEAYFVLPANLKPGGPTGRGWFLVLHRDLSRSLDGRIDHIAIAQQLWSADCAHNTLSWLQDSYFSADGTPIGAYVKPTPSHVYINPSLTTMWTGMLSLLCARPIELDEVDYFSDAVTLRKNWLLPANAKPSAPAAAGAPPPGSAAASSGAPGARPAIKPIPIGPALCPLLRRLETLAHEDFRSIDRGPDRSFRENPEEIHRTSMPIPSARFCKIEHYPGEPVTYTCIWPQATEKEVDDQFVNMGRALEQCTGGTLDLSMLEFGDVTVKVRGVEFVASVINDFMSLSVHMAKP